MRSVGVTSWFLGVCTFEVCAGGQGGAGRRVWRVLIAKSCQVPRGEVEMTYSCVGDIGREMVSDLRSL